MNPADTLVPEKSAIPAVDDPEWAAKARVILNEAMHVTQDLSSRRWMVVHPTDSALLEMAAHFEVGPGPGASVESPRVLLWLSPSDHRLYTLIEYLALHRQPVAARPPADLAVGEEF